jgi:hypothetical protein
MIDRELAARFEEDARRAAGKPPDLDRLDDEIVSAALFACGGFEIAVAKALSAGHDLIIYRSDVVDRVSRSPTLQVARLEAARRLLASAKANVKKNLLERQARRARYLTPKT